MSSRWFSLVTLGLLVSCGGGQPSPAAPSTATPKAEADAGAAHAEASGHGGATPAAQSTFDALTKEQKIGVMITKVVPQIGAILKAHDGAKFATVDCRTCHGPTRKADPQDVLPKLTLSAGGYERLAKAKPEVMRVMAEKVVPTMAAILGEKPYDPATHSGFGCGGCHKVD